MSNHAVKSEWLDTQRLLSCEAARRLVDEALRLGREQDCRLAVAVVDAAGRLKAFVADDGVSPVAPELSQRKARTALLGLASGDLAQALAADAALMHSFLGVETALVGGGVPVLIDGQIVGAIGVGGGLPDQDAAIAQASLAVLAN